MSYSSTLRMLVNFETGHDKLAPHTYEELQMIPP